MDKTNDEQVSQKDEANLSVVKAIDSFYNQAYDARIDRIWKNKQNRDIFLGRQDWGGKIEGQSTEFLPKVGTSSEQMSAFIRKGLIQFGSWFTVEVDSSIKPSITGKQIEVLLMSFLDNLWAGNNRTTDFSTVLSDAVKNGLHESLMIFKVHGGMRKTRKFVAERGNIELTDGQPKRGQDTLKIEEDSEWRLRIDLIRPEDYYPDPTGNGLFEIHELEKDLHEVVASADEGTYIKSVVDELIGVDFPRQMDQERRPEAMNQREAVSPSFRKRVRLREFWGTLLNSDGTVVHENVVATVANEKYLIRPPEPNPFWHQESPFVAAPLVRVPWSVWHKALYDDAANLNLAINDLFNLMIDGGIASVWGTRQIRLGDLEDPDQASGGVGQAATLAVKDTLPHGMKVMETVSNGQVPQDAMAMFQFLNKEFAQAALTSEIKMGNIPNKEVRATEVIEAGQSQATTLDGILVDLEKNVINQLLRKSWMTVLQNADNFPQDVLMGQIDKRAALLIMRASPAERFALFAGMSKFKTFGLSATMGMAREFQKLMALNQAISQNPLLLQAFMQKFDPVKTIDFMMKIINFNPENIQKDSEQLTPQAQQQEQGRTQQAADLTAGGTGGAGAGGQGEASVPAQANQLANPLSGMTANG